MGQGTKSIGSSFAELAAELPVDHPYRRRCRACGDVFADALAADELNHDCSARRCGCCHVLFPTVDAVFSHDCPADRSASRYAYATSPDGVNVDAPEHGEGGGRSEHVPDRASEKALNLLAALCRTTAIAAARLADTAHAPEQLAAMVEQVVADEVEKNSTKRKCMTAIDRCKDGGVTPTWNPATAATFAPPVEGQPARPAHLRENRYPGTCATCGGRVGEGEGYIEKDAGKWITRHLPHGCPERPATAPVERLDAELPDVPEGHYAIESHGTNDLLFVRVDRPTSGTYAGRTFVKMVVGGHPDRNMRRDTVAAVLARIVEAGVAESAQRYGVEIGRCCRCNRHLTDETSRRLGIGPECRSKASF